MIRKIASMILAVLCAVCVSVPVNAEDGSPSFDQFMEDEFIETMESDYMTMHFNVRNYKALGIEKPELTLGDASWESFEDAAEIYDEALRKLQTFDYNSLSRTQQVDYDSYKYYLECMRNLDRYPVLNDYYNPYDGIIDNILTNFTEFVFYEKEDAEDYLTVLESVPAFMEDALDVTRRQAKAGFFLTDAMLDEAEEMIADFTAKKEDNELIVIFNENMDSFSALTEKEKTEYKKRNREIVLNTIIPCYRHVIEELEKLRGSRNFEDGLYNYRDGGEEFYRALVRYKTSSTMSVEDQIELLEEFLMDLIDEYVELYYENRDIDNRFDRQIVKLKTPEETLAYLKDHLQDYPDGPAVEYESSYLDKSLENEAVIAYYITPPFDDFQNNVIKINGGNIEDENGLYETLAHEGFPGHLYQITWYLATNPAKIRSVADHIGYGEGWGMYAEVSAWDNAGLDDDVERLHKIWTALSYAEDAAVDLGVNGLGWDIDDIENFLDQVGLNSDYAQDLMDFVVERPGLILPYGCGLMRFWNLRENAEKQLGNKFDAKAFHTVLLSGGSRPFEMVEADVEQYIQETLGTGKAPAVTQKPKNETSQTPAKPGSDKPENAPVSTPQPLQPSQNTGRKPFSPIPYIAGCAVFTAAALGAWFVLSKERKKDPFA